MLLYLGGTEIPGWRTLLEAEKVTNVSLSYMGLRRRTKFTRPWILSEKYPDDQRIFLDSGAHTVNKEGEEQKYSIAELKDIAAQYMAFVAANIERIDMVSEFDATVLGREWIEAMREDFWGDLPEDKFLPIWHEEWGIDDLDRLCQTYARVGVSSTALGGRSLVPTLNGFVAKYGTKLHGVNITAVDDMSSVKWDSLSTISWISPSQYGDTIVWTGKELKRYPKKYKDSARKRHRTLFISEGFDAQKIEDDDSTEILRLSIWSWSQLVANIERHRGAVVTTTPDTYELPNAELGVVGVDTPPSETRNSRATVRVREASERTNLPVMGLTVMREQYVDPDDGVSKERDVDLLAVRSQSMRLCDSCFLAAKCPAFLERSNCAYDIPVTIKTKDQMQALQGSLIDMQTQRVLFMKMAEDMEGGYADPNLSSEIDRLQKLIKVKTELEQDGVSIKFEAKERGGAGMLSRLFGSEAGASARALPAPVPVQIALERMEIIEAELIDVPHRNN